MCLQNVSRQVQAFLSRLCGGSIGLTALGMFVVDKPSILTVSIPVYWTPCVNTFVNLFMFGNEQITQYWSELVGVSFEKRTESFFYISANMCRIFVLIDNYHTLQN